MKRTLDNKTPKKRRFDSLSENSEQESDDSPDIEFLPRDVEELQDRAKEILNQKKMKKKMWRAR